jgi:hypothetical protein
MADTYWSISLVANNPLIRERMNAAAVQQDHLGTVTLEPDALQWVGQNAYLWASSPGWGEAWEYALLTHADDPNYDPGNDPAVITDAMILATVQSLGAPEE